jgi:hypothetical protein
MKKIFSLIICFIASATLIGCQSVQNQYSDYKSKNFVYSYFALAQVINDDNAAMFSASNNSQEQANESALNGCRAHYSKNCIIAYEGDRFVKNDSLKKLYVAKLKNVCSSFGFKEDTKEFSNCLMRQHQNNIAIIQQQRQIQAANDAATSAAVNNYLRNFGSCGADNPLALQTWGSAAACAGGR